MQIVNVLSVKQNHSFTWPGGDTEMFDVAVTYETVSADGKHEVTVGYGERTKKRNQDTLYEWEGEGAELKIFTNIFHGVAEDGQAHPFFRHFFPSPARMVGKI